MSLVRMANRVRSSRSQPQLLQDVGPVAVDGLYADPEDVGDRRVEIQLSFHYAF